MCAQNLASDQIRSASFMQNSTMKNNIYQFVGVIRFVETLGRKAKITSYCKNYEFETVGTLL